MEFARMQASLTLSSLSAAALLFGSWSAAAAVRMCQSSVSSGIALGATEEEARKQAMSAWRAKAMAFGEPYASWRIASNKLFHCLPHKGGGFECIAYAMPCTIEQAPSRRHLRENRIEM